MPIVPQILVKTTANRLCSNARDRGLPLGIIKYSIHTCTKRFNWFKPDEKNAGYREVVTV